MTCKNLLPLLFADDTNVSLIASANVEFSTIVKWLQQNKLILSVKKNNNFMIFSATKTGHIMKNLKILIKGSERPS